MPVPDEKLNVARRHLARVVTARKAPTGWDDLALYGFYCLEAAVDAAAVFIGLKTSRRHWEKVDNGRRAASEAWSSGY